MNSLLGCCDGTKRPECFGLAVLESSLHSVISRLLDCDDALLSTVSKLEVLREFSLTVVFGIDDCLDLRCMVENGRVCPSFTGVGARGQSFKQSAGRLSADIEISLNSVTGVKSQFLECFR